METGWWQALVPADASAPRRHAGVYSAAYPDGHRVPLSPDEYQDHESDVVCVAIFGADDTVTGIDVSAGRIPKAPPLWWVELRDTAEQPPAVHLLAFAGHGVAPGTLLDEAAVSNVEVAPTDQLGAIRWYPVSGVINQIYVAPDQRRRGIATALLHASAILSAARGWPRMWADGQRTELGDKLRNGGEWRPRGAERTHIAPPMDPELPSTSTWAPS